MNAPFWRPLPAKLQLYEALYSLNRGFEATLSSLERLEHLGMFRLENLNAFKVALEHTRAQANEELVETLCAMNLFLHGVGTDPEHPVIEIADSLELKTELVDMVLTNPPFGKKSSFTIIGRDGKKQTDKISYERPDFWATTSNKQLNFVQHVYSMLKENGRGAVVVPDNVLFEGGAGEKIRRELLQQCDVHTLLRLPTGIWYSAGVKANVFFFDKKSVAQSPATKEIWIYDLRTNRSFSIRQNPIRTEDLTDFIQCYCAADRTQRKETAHFRRFTYSEIIARDKANLDIQWQQETTNGSQGETPQVLLKEILKDLDEAMREFAAAASEIVESNLFRDDPDPDENLPARRIRIPRTAESSH